MEKISQIVLPPWHFLLFDVAAEYLWAENKTFTKQRKGWPGEVRQHLVWFNSIIQTLLQLWIYTGNILISTWSNLSSGLTLLIRSFEFIHRPSLILTPRPCYAPLFKGTIIDVQMKKTATHCSSSLWGWSFVSCNHAALFYSITRLLKEDAMFQPLPSQFLCWTPPG